MDVKRNRTNICGNLGRQLQRTQTGVKLPVMSAALSVNPEQCVKTRHPVHAQVTGKILITCPNCGNLIWSQLNWNTWRVRCKHGGCQATVLIGIHALVPRTNTFKRKFVRPIDTTFPRLDVMPWTSGAPANCLLEDDPDSID